MARRIEEVVIVDDATTQGERLPDAFMGERKKQLSQWNCNLFEKQ
jgi:hypothetical protein